ncbi:carboxypeptidase-like regulatory domain-containing protein [uncultured Tenacibaculum sp.]|uniref:carboxypeptidase-like regulatory domain-containing protein n=1 Tax=uncultured Tenacibaculum sp. TaxID=174713 RepID=UPI002620C292|nr:carboxypeptidase-like regulatory domain-containing protein [uncultured Tenacibaculum sp.]
MIKVRLFLISFLFSVLVFAQKEVPLLDILNSIEKTYNIKFSFSEDIIKNKSIKVDSGDDLLAVLIQQIEKKTGLKIKKINDRYYTIVANTDNIKISGYILDENTQTPLLDAAVFTKKKGVGTDEKGYFELKGLHEKDTVTFSFVGYENIQKTVAELKKEKSINVYLKESSQTLNEIIISSYLTTGIAKKSDGAITLIPRKQGVLPGLTEADVLLSTQQLPGIQSPIESASGIHIRGGTPDQNLILFDGIKLYNTSHFFGSISAFNPYVVDNVTVYKNASNAKYGNHVSGVIDIETMSDVPKKISAGAGFNFTNADINATIPLGEKLGVQFSFRRSISDLLDTPTFDKLSQKVFQNTAIADGETQAEEQPFIEDENNFSFIDFNTKVIYQPNDKNKISFQQIRIKNDLEYELNNEVDNQSRYDFIDIQNEGYGITWNRGWSENLSQETSINYTNYKLFYNGNKKRDGTINDYTIKNNEVKEVTFSSIFNQKLNDISELNFGYQFTHSDISFSLDQENLDLSKRANESDKKANNQQTILAEYVLSKSKKYNFNVGLRTSYMPLLRKTFLEPRIYGRVQVLPSFWLNTSAEIKQQYTSKIIEFFTSDFGLENELWAISNGKDVPILKSQQVTFGFLFDKGGWLIDTEAYYKNIEGLTSLSTGLDSNSSETIFNGKAAVLGIDILLKKKWTSNISSWVSYTFGENTMDFTGFNDGKSFKGNFNISNALYVAQQLKFGNFDFSLGWTFRTGLPFSDVVDGGFDVEQEQLSQKFENRNQRQLPNFHRLDASATYDFYWSKSRKVKSKIGLSFINIYNRKNILRRTYEEAADPLNSSRSIINTVDTFSLGFTPNVVFRVQF